MKSLKKMFALVLAFCMTLSIPVMADTAIDVAGTEYEEAVSKLTELSILTGYEDGTFRPKGTITRAEFSAIISRVIGLSGEVTAENESANFTDVSDAHWAKKYIDLAFSKGIINGYGNGLFGPEDKVTYEQAVKMIVCTLGFEAEATDKGGYPTGYLAVADEKEITKGTKGEVGASAPRGLIAQLIFNSLSFVMEEEAAEGTTYYVAPTGDDKNPGTEDKPFASARKAANVAKAGDTVIFEDGVYNEKFVTLVENSGTKDKPIVFKSRNKHGAKLVYPENLRLTKKFVVSNKEYITIQDFEMTQVACATNEDTNKTSDILIHVGSSNNVNVVGNKLYNVFEEGIKISHSNGILIEGNTVIDSAHEGIDFVYVCDSILRNNEIIDAGRVGLMIKGGSRSVQIYNNYIHNKEKRMGDTAITIGGSTDSLSTYDSTSNGYEGYSLVAFNNIIVSETPGQIKDGISFNGTKDSAAYNNLVVGAQYGLKLAQMTGTKKNWDWDPYTENPVVKNNIFMNCTEGATRTVGIVINPDCDYNLYFNCPDMPEDEPNSLFENPNFVNEYSDWNIVDNKSPIVGRGLPLESFTGSAGQKIQVNFDYEGNIRGDKWSMGPFEYLPTGEKVTLEGVVFQDPKFKFEIKVEEKIEVPEREMPEKGTVVMEETFAENVIDKWTLTGGDWVVKEGVLEQANPKTSKAVITYNDGLWWSDFEYSADITAPQKVVENFTGLLFRCDASRKNMYVFRISGKSQLEFAMWVNGSFVSLAKWDFDFTPGEVYNLKVSVASENFVFYVNGEEVKSISDITHTRGTVGFYTYTKTSEQGGEFDNIKVVSMKQD